MGAVSALPSTSGTVAHGHHEVAVQADLGKGMRFHEATVSVLKARAGGSEVLEDLTGRHHGHDAPAPRELDRFAGLRLNEDGWELAGASATEAR